MKLIQANIWGGRLDKQINSFFSSENPDIVCLQEVNDVPGGETGFFTTYDELRKNTKIPYGFFSPVYSFNFMRRSGSFGNAILSKLPLIKTETIFTRLSHLDNFDFLENDDYNIRNLQHVTVDVKGKILHILNHHGHHIRQHKNGDLETMRQCKIIAEYIATLKGSVILTGDFNLSPHSESLEQVNKLLTNLSVTFGLTTTRNQLTYKSEVCDYIFVSDDIHVNSFTASDELISDHKALILNFEV